MLRTVFPLHPRLRLALEVMALLVLTAPLAIGAASLSTIGHRWTDILAQFTAPALAATMLFALGLLAMRLKAAWASVAVSALLFLALWPQTFPRQGQASPSAPAMRLYSANLYAMNDDARAIRRSIVAADADVLVLVEFGEGPAAVMDDILAGYPHRHVSEAVSRSEDVVRTVIASRHPLSPRSTQGAERQMISAVVSAPSGPIRVVAVHLTRPWPYQYQWGQIIQTQNLIDHIRDAPEPVVLAGDFNSVAAGRIGRMLRAEAGLVNARGWPGTWPAALPGPFRIAIDQVYRTPDIAVTSRRLGQPTGSDHLPLVVDLARADQASVRQTSPRAPASPSDRATQSQTSRAAA